MLVTLESCFAPNIEFINQFGCFELFSREGTKQEDAVVEEQQRDANLQEMVNCHKYDFSYALVISILCFGVLFSAKMRFWLQAPSITWLTLVQHCACQPRELMELLSQVEDDVDEDHPYRHPAAPTLASPENLINQEVRTKGDLIL